ncbi:lysine--tRNA ligase, putative [Plasmodium ovale]|uniref:lysine--tRNA ligase n=1 Tax=Plasmodium ovale TaxID=36330 RepID=A0A1C3KXH7_PLAOA|nr:lysine--tRNA ligase, putative [Plasmodium ovale]
MKKKKRLLFLLLSSLLLLCNNPACFRYRNNELKGFFTQRGKSHICNNRGRTFTLHNYGKEFNERVKKLNFLSNELNIDVYPSSFIKRTIKIDDLKKKYDFLKNGEKDNGKTYVIYGRVVVKRNNGMFLNIQDDVGSIQIYVDENIVFKANKLEQNDHVKGKIANMASRNLDEPCEYDSICKSNNEDETNYRENYAHVCRQSDQHKKENQISARKIIEVGDFIAVKGFIRKSPRGEITLHTKEIYILTKSLLPLPDKYKGMKDVEYKHRKRYLDFLTNKEQKEKIITRFKLIQEIRQFLLKKNYLEVDTPILQLIPGGATAKAFETFLKSLNLVLYLRIAPELYLKKLIISGLSEQIFELSKCFRNEGISSIHNPEFTLLEIYKSYTNYRYMMKFTEKLIKTVAKKFPLYENSKMILQKKWKKISFIKIVKKYTSINFLKLSFHDAYKEAQKLNIQFDQERENLNWGLVVEEVFKRKVEPFLPKNPIHIFHLPSDTSPLSKMLNKNKKLSERFETYIGKMEIANGYSEEANAIIQEKKFISQYTLKDKINKENVNCADKLDHDEKAKENNKISITPRNFTKDNKLNFCKEFIKNENYQIDYDYVTALAHGLPPTGGLGIGIDRLCMLLTNSNSIKNVLSFPIIKPN